MLTVVSSAVSPDNPNVWRVVIAIPNGQTFYTITNMPRLRYDADNELGMSRLFSLNQHNDNEIDFGFYSPPTQAEQTACDALVANHDHTVLTPEQQAAADLAAELATVNANIDAAKASKDAIRGPRDTNGTQTAAGLKDQVNGNATFSVTGLKPPLVGAVFNPLSNADKITRLRDALMGGGGQKGVLDILIDLLNIDQDGANADIVSLKELKKRLNIEDD